MALKKKQHFVSQFLIKKFAIDQERKFVHLYNRKTDTVVNHALIKTQAQENYYYGNDLTFEEFLSVTEERAAPVIAEILESGLIPKIGDKRYSYLLHFVMLYHSRTKAQVDHTEENLNATLKALSKYDSSLQQLNLDELRLKHPEPAAFNLACFMDDWVVTADLHAFLLTNHTGKDFFLSDNPLITFNPFMQKRKYYWAANSHLSKGLILLFPLSPDHYLMLIDPYSYDVKCTAENRIHVDKASDLYNINLLQSVSADKNLYYRIAQEEAYIKSLAMEGLRNKKSKLISELVPCPGKPEAKCLFSYHLAHTLNLSFSFIRESEEAKAYDVTKQRDHPRNQEIVDWMKQVRLKRKQDVADS
ncbi:DUF4238 domain-containing protein [Pedobacter panaciterrae]|uniref:DUF4238 domain-containing protein n=1 Tax=Pedobacter panaciterrae TaxID=363849 RepID=A0ABU8NIJ3_9SPHI